MSLLKPPPNIRSADDHIGLEDFYAVPESHQFIYMPTRAHWPKESVDSILPTIQMPYKKNGKFVKLLSPRFGSSSSGASSKSPGHRNCRKLLRTN